MRRALALLILTASAAQAGEPRLTDASVRAFVARQEAAWNARDAAGFAATFTPDATIVDQARDNQNRLVENGRSTVPQATAQARRFFAKHTVRETTQIGRIVIAPDGRSAQVFAHEVSQVATRGQPNRTLCGETEQSLILVKGGIRSRGQTDTAIRCPH